MARGDVVIANSHFTADAIRRLFPQVAGDRVRVIHRGTDLSAFTPGQVADRVGGEVRVGDHHVAPRHHRVVEELGRRAAGIRTSPPTRSAGSFRRWPATGCG
jgi:hypothetical protein